MKLFTAALLFLSNALVSTGSAHASHTLAQAAADPRAAIKARFEKLYESKDRAGCVALWRESRRHVLPTIDQDLEGSLKLVESGSGDPKAIQSMRDRAVWGARAAKEALGHPLILDYALSFAGWNAQDQRRFRDGQKVYKRAEELFSSKDPAMAARTARECVERASPLGDWWGVAMGYGMQGRAYQSQGGFEDALAAYSTARVLYRDLALTDDEYETLTAMVDVLNALERPLRAREIANDAILLADEVGDADGALELLRLRGEIEKKLGDEAAAAATTRELDARKAKSR